ncbi:MAG: type II toxin-antitoxin system PemK/MazF family toxin [Spirochaetia bacterium]|jgi:mRNA interferase MazF|nr:type II toxin-antitoxin system PemK/MazF family toxin [Spirochaetia bacterium]
MINIYKYDLVIVKFPFASSKKYKARPAVVVSSNNYNSNKRNTLLILAISSNIDDKLSFEITLDNWEDAGLLKPSIFKASIATIEKDYIITKIGKLDDDDKNKLENLIKTIC